MPDIGYELDVLIHLGRKDVPVSTPIARKDGGFLRVLTAPEGTRQVALFTYAKGVELAEDEEQHYRYGSAVAAIHTATDDFSSQHNRFHLPTRVGSRAPEGGKMKAVLFDQPGGADVLRLGDAPDPQPGDDELLVRVHATAINRADLLQRRGAYPPPPGASPILGLELAGEVVTPAGEWRAGDHVMAVVTGGGYAELATVPVGMALPIPERLTFEEAAAIPEAFLTAFLNLFTLGRLQPGETALIHAGASGVGTAAIQLARAAGARVVATAGADEKLALCRELGAEVAINYKRESFSDRVREATDGRGVDVVLDFVGAAYWEANLNALAQGGRLMLIGFLGGSRGDLDLGPIMSKTLTVAGTTLRRTPLTQKIALTRAFAEFALPRFERGELRPVIDSVYPLDQVAEAQRHVEANRNAGKVVLRAAF